MKTVQITIGGDLLREVDAAALERGTTRSAFIRRALESELQRRRVAELERLHAAGYSQQPDSLAETDEWDGVRDWGSD